jgi:putative two-component system response regulator
MLTPAKVLVVDDHEANLTGLRGFLQRDYSVVTTTSGTEAIRIAKNAPPDAVLLDVVMPEISGLDVCAELKQDAVTRLIPVVLMSGRGDRQTRIAGIAAGADDFLDKPIDTEELGARMRALVRFKRMTDELESAEAFVLALGRVIEARDSATEGHCERLASYATALGASLGLDVADIDTLQRGAFLHDIGKIGIPDQLLLKKTRLTPREYEVMKSHPLIGDDLCRPIRSLEAVRPIVRHHHERLDGRGYPDRLAGDDIPLVAQIVTVVDVFDALTTDRPYRRALSLDAAWRTMRKEAREGAYAPDLVERLVDLHRRGSIVIAVPARSARAANRRAAALRPSRGN